MILRKNSPVAAALALSLGVVLSGCSTSDNQGNMTLNSVAQPVVERQNFAIDLASSANGLSYPEQQRLAGWFETMNLKYGDRVALDGAVIDQAVQDQVSAIAARYGILLSAGAPVTDGFVNPGTVRVVVSRTRAYVPDCPNWTDKAQGNGTSSGFGCAINSNFAAMVADPEHLLHGATGTGETVVMSSTKAIDSYREQKPTGGQALSGVSTTQGAN
jgi:pilus assembly protein CpaD